MALSAPASFSFPALTSFLTLLFVFAFTSAPLLPGAWASAPASTPPFPVTCYDSAILVQAQTF